MSQPVAPSIEYRRFVPADANLLAEYLSAGDWPYFSGGTPDAAQVRAAVAAGRYDSDQTRSFWIVTPAWRVFILHGCLAHAALATWLGQPCSMTPARAVPQLLGRLPWPP